MDTQAGETDEEYVPPYIAARLTGVPARHIRYWMRSGRVAISPGPYGQLVRLADVRALAAAEPPPAP